MAESPTGGNASATPDDFQRAIGVEECFRRAFHYGQSLGGNDFGVASRKQPDNNATGVDRYYLRFASLRTNIGT